MKTTTLKIVAAAVLGLASVSAVNAAPAVFGGSTLIAYDQGGNDPFPSSSGDAIPDAPSIIAYDQGGNDPFPTSAPEAGVTA